MKASAKTSGLSFLREKSYPFNGKANHNRFIMDLHSKEVCVCFSFSFYIYYERMSSMFIWIILAFAVGAVVGGFVLYVYTQSMKIGYLRVDTLEFEEYHSPDFYMEVHDPERIGELKNGDIVVLEVKTDMDI